MKYHQSSRFPKAVGSAGFYAIIACCLIAIGAATWFAVSRKNSAESVLPDSSSSNKEVSSYEEPSSTYNNSSPELPNTTPQQPNVSAANPVSDIPYSSDEASQSTDVHSFAMPVIGNISKGYSDTALQFSPTYGDMRLHTGIDIVCEKGTTVNSAGGGTVTAVEDSSTLGKFITIDHGNGIVAKYCGFENVVVNTGDSVGAGTPIGSVGTIPSECAEKSHIHIEVFKDGKCVSPLAALGLE